MDEDLFEAILAGQDPNKTKMYAQKLRDQGMLGDVSALSFDKPISQFGTGYSDRAMNTGVGLGKARAALEEANTGRTFRTDERLAGEKFEAEQRELDRKNRLREAATARAAKAAEKAEVDWKAVERYGKERRKDKIPALRATFANIDKTLAPYLDPKTGELIADIPGMGGVAGFLHSSLLSDEGKTVRQGISSLRNQVLAARSGAAVTDPEAARLYEEIGHRLGSTDKEVMVGLAQLRGLLEEQEYTLESSFDPDVIRQYNENEAKVKAKTEGGGASAASGYDPYADAAR